MEELFTMSSLARDMENDFLRKSPFVVEFSGGNGLWKVKISGNFHEFKKSIKDYAKTRIYMHLQDIEILSNSSGTVLVSLL